MILYSDSVESMKRVLLTSHKFFPQHRAGTEVLTLKVAQELQRRGYEVLVVTANPPDIDARHAAGPDASQYEYEGVPVYAIEEPVRLKDYKFPYEFWHPGMKAQFDTLLRKFAPHIVHPFHCQNLSASIIDSSLEMEIPVVCSTTDFWFVCPVVQLKRPNGEVCRGPDRKALNCLTCYTPSLFPPAEQIEEALVKRIPALSSPAVAPPLRALGTKMAQAGFVATRLPSAVTATLTRPGDLRDRLNRTNAVMVPTRLMLDIFVENGINRDIIHHVPFGLDTAPLVAHENKVQDWRFRFGFIGTIFEHKGVDLLVKAFQSLPGKERALLKIYGDMSQFPEYGATIRRLIENDPAYIRLEGTFPNSKFGNVLSEIDVLIIPSRWYENTPLVLQSSLATKTPLIVTDLGGLSELVKPGVNGLLFELNNYVDLKNKMLQIMGDAQLYAKMRQSIGPERTIAAMVDDIEEVYANAASMR